MISKYGVTKDGFLRPTYYDLLEIYKEGFRNKFGEDINLSPHSPLGILAEDRAWYDSIYWEHMEDVYYSSFYGYATGFSLDNVGKNIGAARAPAIKSKGEITIEGKAGTKIPNGFRISDSDVEKVFEVIRHGVIGEDGKVTLPIISLEAGKETNVNAMELDKMANPIPGITKVYNIEVTYGGKDAETDEEFRAKYEKSSALGGGSTTAAIRAKLLTIDEVTDAEVAENEEMVEVNGLPPKCVAPLVFGGEDEDIAEAILKTKAGGIRSFGTTIVEIEDDRGEVHKIGFTRPELKDIYVDIKVKREDGYPGDRAVKRAVLNYVGGKDLDGIEYTGLGFNKDVVVSKIMAAVMCLKGTEDIEVEIGLDKNNMAAKNIPIGPIEMATTTEDKVVIQYV